MLAVHNDKDPTGSCLSWELILLINFINLINIICYGHIIVH